MSETGWVSRSTVRPQSPRGWRPDQPDPIDAASASPTPIEHVPSRTSDFKRPVASSRDDGARHRETAFRWADCDCDPVPSEEFRRTADFDRGHHGRVCPLRFSHLLAWPRRAGAPVPRAIGGRVPLGAAEPGRGMRVQSHLARHLPCVPGPTGPSRPPLLTLRHPSHCPAPGPDSISMSAVADTAATCGIEAAS